LLRVSPTRRAPPAGCRISRTIESVTPARAGSPTRSRYPRDWVVGMWLVPTRQATGASMATRRRSGMLITRPRTHSAYGSAMRVDCIGGTTSEGDQGSIPTTRHEPGFVVASGVPHGRPRVVCGRWRRLSGLDNPLDACDCCSSLMLRVRLGVQPGSRRPGQRRLRRSGSSRIPEDQALVVSMMGSVCGFSGWRCALL
jgi:hypothetical protein